MGAQILSSNISICFWRKDIARQVSLPTSITPDPALGLDLGKWLLVLCCSLLLPDHAPPSFLALPTLNLIYQNMLPDPPPCYYLLLKPGLTLDYMKILTSSALLTCFPQHYHCPNSSLSRKMTFASLVSVLHNLCSTQILCLPYMVNPPILVFPTTAIPVYSQCQRILVFNNHAPRFLHARGPLTSRTSNLFILPYLHCPTAVLCPSLCY